MNCLYLKQCKWLRFVVLAILGVVASTASAAETDLGELELDKVYTCGYDNYSATFTAPKSGNLTYHNQSTGFSAYSDAAHTTEIDATYGGYGDGGYQLYTIKVTAGTVYYFYTDNCWGGNFFLSMDNGVELSNSSIEAGATLSASGTGAVTYQFNQSIAVESVTLTGGNVTKTLTTADETYRLNGNLLTVNYGKILLDWYNSGVISAGSEITVSVTGLCSATDASVKYGDDGSLVVKYVAGEKPVTLVSATTGDGTYTLTNTQYAPCKFLSYFLANNPDGKYVFTFSAPIDPEAGTYELNFGSQEADDWYTETVTPTFSNDNKTLTFDLTGKTRDYKVMSSIAHNYGEIYLSLRSVKSADGQLVYTGVSGSEGSYTFPFKYEVVECNAAAEFPTTESLANASTLEIYVSNYAQIDFDGVQFSYTANREKKSVVVAKSDLTITTDEYDGATIVVTVPEEVKTANNVTVTFNNIIFNDGADHSADFTKVFNVVAKTVDSDVKYSYTPNTEAAVESCDQLVITFDGYTNVTYGEGQALMSGRTNTAYVLLDAATVGENGTMIQPIKDATANDHYTVTFPEGYFELDDNVVSPELTATFAVYKEETPTETEFNFTSTPANGATVESCNEIVIAFTDYALAGNGIGTATIQRRGDMEYGVKDLPVADLGAADNEMKQGLNNLATEEGMYIVTFPAGYFDLNDENENAVSSPEFYITFIVEKAKTIEFKVESNPESGSTVESCDKVILTFPNHFAVDLCSGKATIQLRGNDEYGIKNLGDAEIDMSLPENQIVQPLNGLAENEGYYILTFPEGYFNLTASEDDTDPVASPQFYITFIVEKPKSFNFTSTPADGSIVESCDQIDIIFTDYTEVGPSWNGKATIAKDGGEAQELGDMQTDNDVWNKITQPLGGKAAEAGTYVVSFPEGYFVGDEAHNYDNLPAFTITFTIDNTNGINNIAVDGTEAVYYNLNGVQVVNPAKGIYIVKRGNKVTKEALK